MVTFATNEANDETMKQQQDLEKEFTQMIIENRQIIFKVCYIYTTDEYTIEELSQETLLNLWRAYPRFRGESELSTWIYRVAMNTCISYMRQASSRPQTTALPFDLRSDVETDGDRNYYLQELYTMINRLGKLERALILLWLEDRSYAEISEILGISKTNVAVLLHRTKEKKSSSKVLGVTINAVGIVLLLVAVVISLLQ